MPTLRGDRRARQHRRQQHVDLVPQLERSSRSWPAAAAQRVAPERLGTSRRPAATICRVAALRQRAGRAPSATPRGSARSYVCVISIAGQARTRIALDHLVAELVEQPRRSAPTRARWSPDSRAIKPRRQLARVRDPQRARRRRRGVDVAPGERRRRSRRLPAATRGSRRAAARCRRRSVRARRTRSARATPRAAGWVETRPRRRLHPDQPAASRGDPDRAAAVGAGRAGTIPDATAAAEPPDEPPGVRVGSQGLRVTPFASVAVHGKIVSSGTLVMPIGIAPAARSRRTTSPSAASGGPNAARSAGHRLAGDRYVVLDRDRHAGERLASSRPGFASRRPRRAPRRRSSRGTRSASGRAASIRRTNNSTSSRGFSSRRRTMSASAPGPANARSCSSVAVMPGAPSRARGSRPGTGM